MVEPFLLEHSPESLARSTFYHSKYRPKEWLKGLLPMLTAKEIGAISALREVAGVPDEIASGFAGMALEIIGEEVPYKLTQQVPQWTIQDVSQWVKQIGFGSYSEGFEEQMVDGDMLLLITDEQLCGDIHMKSSLLRQRFLRELDHLKIAADYSSIDGSKIDKLLASIHPKFSTYTYRILQLDLDVFNLHHLNEDLLSNNCAVSNPIHRLKILEACKGVSPHELSRGELMTGVKEDVDIFISYRRSSGSQLASLIRVMLKLRGFKVFIDVDRLSAGVFDASLLHHIRAATHFLLILSPGALDRCIQDDLCEDWVHKEILCALDCRRNIIPILDPKFHWPGEGEGDLPEDIRDVKRFNAVNWIHEYQEACLEKVIRFLKDPVAKTSGPPVTSSTASGGGGGSAMSSPSCKKISRTGSRKLVTQQQPNPPTQQQPIMIDDLIGQTNSTTVIDHLHHSHPPPSAVPPPPLPGYHLNNHHQTNNFICGGGEPGGKTCAVIDVVKRDFCVVDDGDELQGAFLPGGKLTTTTSSPSPPTTSSSLSSTTNIPPSTTTTSLSTFSSASTTLTSTATSATTIIPSSAQISRQQTVGGGRKISSTALNSLFVHSQMNNEGDEHSTVEHPSGPIVNGSGGDDHGGVDDMNWTGGNQQTKHPTRTNNQQQQQQQYTFSAKHFINSTSQNDTISKPTQHGKISATSSSTSVVIPSTPPINALSAPHFSSHAAPTAADTV